MGGMLMANSFSRVVIQHTCFDASERDIYSASVAEVAMVFCFWLTQETGEALNKMKKPVHDFLSFLSEAQSVLA